MHPTAPARRYGARLRSRTQTRAHRPCTPPLTMLRKPWSVFVDQEVECAQGRRQPPPVVATRGHPISPPAYASTSGYGLCKYSVITRAMRWATESYGRGKSAIGGDEKRAMRQQVAAFTWTLERSVLCICVCRGRAAVNGVVVNVTKVGIEAVGIRRSV